MLYEDRLQAEHHSGHLFRVGTGSDPQLIVRVGEGQSRKKTAFMSQS
jgi:hypothetical protein